MGQVSIRRGDGETRRNLCGKGGSKIDALALREERRRCRNARVLVGQVGRGQLRGSSSGKIESTNNTELRRLEHDTLEWERR